MKAFCVGFTLGMMFSAAAIYYAQFLKAWSFGESNESRAMPVITLEIAARQLDRLTGAEK